MATASSIDIAALAARLRMTATRLSRQLRRETEGDLSASASSALATVERLGPIGLGELADVEQVRPPTMTKIAASLADQGLVVRKAGGDRRRAFLELTSQGQQLMRRNRQLKTAYLARRFDELTSADLATLDAGVAILERLVESNSSPAK